MSIGIVEALIAGICCCYATVNNFSHENKAKLLPVDFESLHRFRSIKSLFLAVKMARLVQRPPKYLPEEWRHSNKLKYSSAEKERQAAERIRDETNRLVVETDQTTIKTQSDVDKKLDQRLTDVSYWKAELDRQHTETNGEIENLLQFKARLEQAIVDTEIPLNVAKDCLVVREERVDIDNVHDDVEVQLLKVI